MYRCTLFRKRAFLLDENVYSSLYGENVCSRLLNWNMEIFFEKLLRPPNEANFSFHWTLAPRTAVQRFKTTEFADFYRACPGVPEATRVPEFDLYVTI